MSADSDARVKLTPDELSQTLAHLSKADVLHRVKRIGADGSIELLPEDREGKVEKTLRKARNGFDD